MEQGKADRKVHGQRIGCARRCGCKPTRDAATATALPLVDNERQPIRIPPAYNTWLQAPRGTFIIGVQDEITHYDVATYLLQRTTAHQAPIVKEARRNVRLPDLLQRRTRFADAMPRLRTRILRGLLERLCGLEDP